MKRLLTMGLMVGSALVWTSMSWAGDAKGQKRPEPIMKNLAGLKVGDEAPDFEFPKPDAKEEGEMAKLSDYKGEKNVLLAFYPKAFTGGCTRQLCGYRDDYSRFQDNDTEVIAISADVQDESDRFKAEHEMPFIVFGDAEKKVIENFGIPLRERGDSSFAQRSVILVDKKGEIAFIDMNYSINDDKDPLYEVIEEINGASSEKS